MFRVYNSEMALSRAIFLYISFLTGICICGKLFYAACSTCSLLTLACTRICWLAEGGDARQACHAAFHQGVDLLPRISRLLLFPQARSGLVQGYACANPQAIRAAVDRLALEKVRATGLEASLFCRWIVANVADYSVAGAMLPSILCLSPVVGRYCHPGAGRSSYHFVT